MKKLIALGVIAALGVAPAYAQPAPQKPPTPTPTPTPTPDPKGPKTDEKADSNNLHGQNENRPWAIGVTPARQKAALEHFAEGNEQLNFGAFGEAVKHYRKALESWKHPAIHYNMALALMNLDQPVEVYDALEQAVKYGEAPLEKDKFDNAKQYLLVWSKQIAEIEVTCRKEGAKVSVDGKEVFTVQPGEVGIYRGRVRIGKHTFVAEKPGYNAQVNAPFIEPGAKFRIELELYTAEELTRYRRRWDATWMPYVVVGAGLAIGGGAALMHQSANTSYSEFDAAIASCNEQSMNGGCMISPALTGMRDDGDRKKLLGYVGYGVAGATVVTGLVLAILNRQTSYEITADQYRAEQAKLGNLSFSPMLSPDGAGAMVFGRF